MEGKDTQPPMEAPVRRGQFSLRKATWSLSRRAPDPRKETGHKASVSIGEIQKPRKTKQSFPLRLMGKGQVGAGRSLSPGLAAPSLPALGPSTMGPKLLVSTALAAPCPAWDLHRPIGEELIEEFEERES